MAYRTKSIKPLKMSQNRLPLQFSIVVPSTEYDKKINEERFSQRVNDEKKYLDKTFQGDTTIKAEGDYFDSKRKKVISEKVAIVEVATTPEMFEQNRTKIENHIKNRKNNWKQQSVMYKIEGESFIYPRQKKADTYKEKDGILLS